MTSLTGGFDWNAHAWNETTYEYLVSEASGQKHEAALSNRLFAFNMEGALVDLPPAFALRALSYLAFQERLSTEDASDPAIVQRILECDVVDLRVKDSPEEWEWNLIYLREQYLRTCDIINELDWRRLLRDINTMCALASNPHLSDEGFMELWSETQAARKRRVDIADHVYDRVEFHLLFNPSLPADLLTLIFEYRVHKVKEWLARLGSPSPIPFDHRRDYSTHQQHLVGLLSHESFPVGVFGEHEPFLKTLKESRPRTRTREVRHARLFLAPWYMSRTDALKLWKECIDDPDSPTPSVVRRDWAITEAEKDCLRGVKSLHHVIHGTETLHALALEPRAATDSELCEWMDNYDKAKAAKVPESTMKRVPNIRDSVFHDQTWVDLYDWIAKQTEQGVKMAYDDILTQAFHNPTLPDWYRFLLTFDTRFRSLGFSTLSLYGGAFKYAEVCGMGDVPIRWAIEAIKPDGIDLDGVRLDYQ